ncbi:MAG: transketolase family protein [Elusimicrobia bacterium]|jgi:transketolase|nr:transketolase family protein [Elusimicrobiota bacterium]
METKAVRDGYGEALVEFGREDKRIVVLSADLEDANRTKLFEKEFPERFYTFGISEQDMVGEGAGFSMTGFIPFVNSFAVFLTTRAYDQIRVSLCYNKANVKLVGSHPGLEVGNDGATAQSLEDIAVMSVLPEMRVICPADAVEARKATKALIESKGPVYMRSGRRPWPVITEKETPFEIGKSVSLKEGKDVTLIAYGIMVHKSLEAAKLLSSKGIKAGVINMHTIKPLDRYAVLSAAKDTGAIVVSENHQKIGGLGSAVARVISETNPVPIEFVAVDNSFGESGSPGELQKKYGLDTADIVSAAKRAVNRKK